MGLFYGCVVYWILLVGWGLVAKFVNCLCLVLFCYWHVVGFWVFVGVSFAWFAFAVVCLIVLFGLVFVWCLCVWDFSWFRLCWLPVWWLCRLFCDLFGFGCLVVGFGLACCLVCRFVCCLLCFDY